MKLEIISRCEKDTSEFAKSVARIVPTGTIISLVGDLGAGKTTFVKSFALGLNCNELITSPTFTILNEYLTGDKKIYHFDFYRIESVEELEELGFDSYFNNPDGITVVEWVSKAPRLLPKKFIQITFEKIDEDTRKIILEEMVK